MRKLGVFLVVSAIGYFYQESIARPSVKDPQSDEQVIRISAKTFEFQPSEITVKKGIPVTLELISTDRHHGFKLPAFQLRADIRPGSVEKIRTPARPESENYSQTPLRTNIPRLRIKCH